MTKRIMVGVVAAMLLTAAAMTGCGSDDDDEQKSETTTLAVTTTAEEETSSIARYGDYDSFIEAIGTDYPGVAMIVPLPVQTGEWELTAVDYGRDDATYTYYLTTPSGDSLALNVYGLATYADIDALEAAINADVGDEYTVVESYRGSRWLCVQGGDYQKTMIVGLSSDENIAYMLSGESVASATELEASVLVDYVEQMRL